MRMTGRIEDDAGHAGRGRHVAWLAWIAVMALAACSAPPPTSATTLYVSPQGDDQSGSGSASQPYRSLTAAVAQAPAGATILLADGTYAAATGEVFPIDVSGLDIQGASKTGTILSASTAALYGLTITQGEVALRDLAVEGFGTDPTGANVGVSGGTVLLENVVLSNGARYGLEVLNGDVSLRAVTVTGNEDDSVFARGSATLDVSNSLISGSLGADGIDMDDDVALRLRDSQIRGNEGSGIEISGGSADLGTAADPGGNTITGNALEGGNAAQIEDDRPTGASLISAYGNDLGVTVTGLKTGPDALGDTWSIDGAGNQIDFGP